ncbi:MAG: hypothetical protein M3R70_04630 [Actinomycetota bacterium]|nr:hypothetical protein [Actinomycetota bacterium]
MSQSRARTGLGLGEAFAVWSLLGVFVGAIFWTYARLPAWQLYHVSTSGPSAGAGRALVFLNFPAALVAIALALIAYDRLTGLLETALTALSIALCAVVAWPGVVDQHDLDARYVNALPALGVALAFGLTVLAARRSRTSLVARAPGDRARLVLGVLIGLFSLHYVTGEFGVYAERAPVVRWIFIAREPWAPFGQANLRPAVHLGHHHGFDGSLLALAALFLSRPLGTLRRRGAQGFLAVYLAVMLAYGLANFVQDNWGEQLVKRGWLDWSIPSVLVPAATPEFIAVIGSGLLVYLLFFRRLTTRRPLDAAPMPAPLVILSAACAAVFAGLGLTADGHTVRTPAPSESERRALAAEGPIAFPMVDRGYGIFTMRGDGTGLRHVGSTEHGRDLAPSWSPDARRLALQSNPGGNTDVFAGRRRLTTNAARDGEPDWSPRRGGIAFVSTRTGNPELYLVHSSGRGKPPRLTQNDADDEWPSYSAVNPIVFQSNRGGDFDLYLINEDRSDLHRLLHLRGDERTPAWSPDLSAIAFEHGGDLYVVGVDYGGRATGVRRLTRGPGNDFAPAWSRDGRLIVFGSDRDGRDQIFVVRADGKHVRRLTSRQADKDAPDWSG